MVVLASRLVLLWLWLWRDGRARARSLLPFVSKEYLSKKVERKWYPWLAGLYFSGFSVMVAPAQEAPAGQSTSPSKAPPSDGHKPQPGPNLDRPQQLCQIKNCSIIDLRPRQQPFLFGSWDTEFRQHCKFLVEAAEATAQVPALLLSLPFCQCKIEDFFVRWDPLINTITTRLMSCVKEHIFFFYCSFDFERLLIWHLMAFSFNDTVVAT